MLLLRYLCLLRATLISPTSCAICQGWTKLAQSLQESESACKTEAEQNLVWSFPEYMIHFRVALLMLVLVVRCVISGPAGSKKYLIFNSGGPSSCAFFFRQVFCRAGLTILQICSKQNFECGGPRSSDLSSCHGSYTSTDFCWSQEPFSSPVSLWGSGNHFWGTHCMRESSANRFYQQNLSYPKVHLMADSTNPRATVVCFPNKPQVFAHPFTTSI